MNNIVKEVKLDSGLPTISVAMIVKNEAERLPTILECLDGAVEEVVIVDTGSIDDSRLIAEKYGAKVYNFPWCDSFSAARNESLKHCTQDYILFLDADDVIEKQKIMTLKMHLQKNPNTGVFIRLVDMRGNSIFETTQLRMFPRVFPNGEKPSFRYRVHEQVSFSLEENSIPFSFCMDFPLVHKGYDISQEQIQDKFERNLSLILLDLRENPDDFVVLMNAARTTMHMGHLAMSKKYTTEAIQLFQEGKHNIAKEHVLMAYILQTTLLGYAKEDKQAVKLLESVRYLFPDNPIIKFTLGELYYKLKNYEKAYKELLIIREGSMPITSYPIDREASFSIYNRLLLACSLKLNDWKTASLCMGRFLGDKEFNFTLLKK